MSKKSAKSNSLNEKLSSLIQTKPKEFDSDEEDDFTTADKIAQDGSDSNFSAEELGTTKYHKLNNKFLDEDDSKYLGKGVSRKGLNEFDDDESDHEDSEKEQDFSNSEVDVEDEDVEEEEEEGSGDGEFESDSEEECASPEPLQKTEQTPRKRQENDIDINKEIFSRAGKDIEKGKAIKTQLLVWDFLLDCRMKLQSCLVASNQLPSNKNVNKFRANSEFVKSVAETKKSLKHLLRSLLSLQEGLLCTNEEFISSVTNSKTCTTSAESDSEINSDFEGEDDICKEDTKNKNVDLFGNHLKKLQDFSNEIDKRHKQFESYRNSTIQKWDDKTRIGYISSKNFSAFEQSVLKQIDHVMVDKQRLLTRTQTKRSSYHILGLDKDDDEPLEKKSANAEVEQPELSSSQRNRTITNKEIFDDDDFYHQLLSELIKRKASDITDPVQLGRQWMQLQKIRSKMKKTVDTKASKARKVRFVVHPKLVNFMMPTTSSTYNESARIELINSIFGKKK